ncbi:hypothetical protein DFH11DRAFT_1729138 [Phellopilus nigrolimitatus]|nr:hypothetical protein DFH11DRAFT_1729138 [Phellopilus nigrolimitatus]
MAPSSGDSKAEIPDIPWSANDHYHGWRLLAEVENSRKVILGPEHGENTSGERKAAAIRSIAQKLFPDEFAMNARSMENRKCPVRQVLENLRSEAALLFADSERLEFFKTYKKQASRLHQTGGGIGNGVNEYAECYIGVDGPDVTTTENARNLWEKIEADFPFFPRLHRLLAKRTNMQPPALMTGIGPDGRRVFHIQPPESSQALQVPNVPDPNPDLIDPVLRVPQPVPDTHSVLAVPVPSQHDNADKENFAPPPMLSRQPKPSSFGHPTLATAIQKAEENISRTPAKRPFEDKLVELHQNNLEAAKERAAEEFSLKRRKLKIQEKELIERRQATIDRQLVSLRRDYDDGLLDRDEYRRQANRLRARSDAIAEEEMAAYESA